MPDEKQSPPVATFFVNARRDEEASHRVGRDIFVNEIYVRVQLSKNTIPCLRATPEHFTRFPTEWERFRTTPEYQAFASADDGETTFTPLKVLKLSAARLAELESAGVRGVEALATAKRDDIEHVVGWETLQRKATEYLAQKVAAPVTEPAPARSRNVTSRQSDDSAV